MKRLLVLLILVLCTVTMGIMVATPCSADNSKTGQVTCNGTAALIYTPGNPALQKNLSVVITVLTASVDVYVGTSSALTTSTAGLVLSTTGIRGFISEGKGTSWYCITSGSSATVGYTATW
jgi:hypothetical protein